MKSLKTAIENLSLYKVVEILTENIPFDSSFVSLCESNSCGSYGKNYTCPPLIGQIDELIKKAKQYEFAVVFQNVYGIEDSFDIEGMNEAKKEFKKLTKSVFELCDEKLKKFMVLGAGPCDLCKTCGAMLGIECSFPHKAIASLESYGIAVSELANRCNMKYINGINTVTYFGAVLY